MIKKIVSCSILGLVIMALLTAYTSTRTVVINNPEVASYFTITETAKGLPLQYAVNYSNTSGYYGSFIPSDSGLKWSTFVTDYCMWTLLLVVIIFIPGLVFKHHKKPENRFQERLTH